MSGTPTPEGKSPGLRDSAGRVLFVAYHLAPNDARYIKTRRSLLQAGYDVAAVAPRGAAPSHDSVRAAGKLPGPAVASGPLRRVRAFLEARAIAAAIADAAADFRPNVILTYDPEALPAALTAKRRTGAALIFDAHEYHADEDPFHPERGLWVQRMERRIAPHLDGFVTVNESIAERYRRDGRVTLDPLVVHNAVDPVDLPPYDGRLHRAAGLPGDAHILLFHGALLKSRGLHILAGAAAMLPPGWAVVMMGRGPLEAELRRAAGDSLRFIPPVAYESLALWVQGASLGAVLYEPVGENQRLCSPNKLWELPAAGVPILGRDLPEIRRVVQGGQLGWLVSEDAGAGEIAAAIAAIGPADLSAARDRGRAFVELESWSAEAAPLIQLIGRVAAHGGRVLNRRAAP